MSRGALEKIASVVCLALLMALIVAVDERVQERAELAVSQGLNSPDAWQSHLTETGQAMAGVVRYHSISHAPLLLFSIAAVVLVFFMRRT